MSLRSMLFVPGDSARKQAKGLTAGADALILDLEDSVAAARRPEARALVLDVLRQHAGAGPQLWVRINPLSMPDALADLAAVVPGGPDGIVVPKPDGGDDMIRLGHYLDALEAAAGLPIGRTRTIPVATETAPALFGLGSYARVGPRLMGMTWGAEDLAAAVGAASNRLEDGSYEPLFVLARSLCLAGAVAAEVQPIDTVFTDFRNIAGLERECRAARRAGFTGKLAIHPDQVPVINAAFTPSAAEVEHAERVVALFAANPDAGALGLDGKMLDRPHLLQARKVLDAARGG